MPSGGGDGDDGGGGGGGGGFGDDVFIGLPATGVDAPDLGAGDLAAGAAAFGEAFAFGFGGMLAADQGAYGEPMTKTGIMLDSDAPSS